MKHLFSCFLCVVFIAATNPHVPAQKDGLSPQSLLQTNRSAWHDSTSSFPIYMWLPSSMASSPTEPFLQAGFLPRYLFDLIPYFLLIWSYAFFRLQGKELLEKINTFYEQQMEKNERTYTECFTMAVLVIPALILTAFSEIDWFITKIATCCYYLYLKIKSLIAFLFELYDPLLLYIPFTRATYHSIFKIFIDSDLLIENKKHFNQFLWLAPFDVLSWKNYKFNYEQLFDHHSKINFTDKKIFHLTGANYYAGETIIHFKTLLFEMDSEYKSAVQEFINLDSPDPEKVNQLHARIQSLSDHYFERYFFAYKHLALLHLLNFDYSLKLHAPKKHHLQEAIKILDYLDPYTEKFYLQRIDSIKHSALLYYLKKIKTQLSVETPVLDPLSTAAINHSL